MTCDCIMDWVFYFDWWKELKMTFFFVVVIDWEVVDKWRKNIKNETFKSQTFFLFRLLATTSADGTAVIWKTADFSKLTELKENTQRWVWDCAFSGDSQYIITGKSPNKWPFLVECMGIGVVLSSKWERQYLEMWFVTFLLRNISFIPWTELS